MWRRALMVAAWLIASPAEASTLPRVDFAQGQGILAGGVLDVNFDYAVLDNVSVGVSMIPMPSAYAWYDPILSPLNAALRSTWRAGTLWGVPVGLTLSGGIMWPVVVPNCPCGLKSPFPDLPLMRWNGYMGYIQPALNVAVPLKQGAEGWTLRATLGPIWATSGSGSTWTMMPAWPNLEFAYAWADGSELTLLGNALVGWRRVF